MPIVNEHSLTIGWDGGISPCLALMHTYPFYIYGRRKEVNRYVLGFAGEQTLVKTWTSEEYVKFRAKVQGFRFPSCVDCGMNCSFAEENTDCWGNGPRVRDYPGQAGYHPMSLNRSLDAIFTSGV